MHGNYPTRFFAGTARKRIWATMLQSEHQQHRNTRGLWHSMLTITKLDFFSAYRTEKSDFA